MRRIGLIIMMGLLLAGGGVGLGWLAAELQSADEVMIDGAIGAEMPLAETPVADAAKDLPDAADSMPLRVATERTGSLEGELARLRWQLASRRRTCIPDTAAEDAPPGPETVAALDGPRSLIFSPEPAVVEPEVAEPEPAVGEPEPVILQPVVDAPAFAPERERAPEPVVVAVAEPMPPLPPQSAATMPPPSAPTPPPQPAFQPGQALSVPEAALQTGDLGFLEGCWVSSPFSNPVNGIASTKVYCFDSGGNGRMDFRGQDGITCTAPIRARWEPGRRLVLEEPRDGSCSNFGPWYRESTNCSIGSDGGAQCSSYEFFRRFNYGTRLTRT